MLHTFTRPLVLTLVGPPIWRNNSAIQKDNEIVVAGGRNVKSGRQITASERHRKNPKTGKYESGGPFYTVDMHYEVPTLSVKLKSPHKPSYFTYEGPLMTPVPAALDTSDKGISKFRSKDLKDLNPYGTTAISVCAPTNSEANLGTAIAEAHREGIATIPGIQTWKRRTRFYQALAGEFLNVEFGWLPFISDVKDVANVISNHTKMMEHHERGAGTGTRRRFDFPEQTSVSTSTSVGEPIAPHGSILGFFLKEGEDPAMTLTTTTESSVKRWFEGSFTYASPSSTDSWRRALGYGSEANKLLGTSLTPDVLWELTPWSWAVDWFTNAGDVVNNINQFVLQGLVMRYGYMMEERTTIVTNTLSSNKTYKLTGVPPPSKTITVSKVRSPATPFGFGVTWEGLSPIQVAIAAAVGITQLP